VNGISSDMFLNFQIYFICFAFALIACYHSLMFIPAYIYITLVFCFIFIYFQDQSQFLWYEMRVKNETLIYNTALMGHQASTYDGLLCNTYL
jgi:hypothetical protein